MKEMEEMTSKVSAVMAMLTKSTTTSFLTPTFSKSIPVGRGEKLRKSAKGLSSEGQGKWEHMLERSQDIVEKTDHPRKQLSQLLRSGIIANRFGRKNRLE
jgi:hypothetical protein